MLYSGEGSPACQPKYILIRKFLKFFGLYPNIRGKHFQYERANSFMAPEIYEYVSMMRMTSLRKTDTVMYIGCGGGTLSLAFGETVKKVVGVDTDAKWLKDARFKTSELSGVVYAEFYGQKLKEIGFEQESFDKIFSFS